MFKPKYVITDRLLANIKKINGLISELNNRRFTNVVLLEFEKEARAVSSYASTSIEGNPLPLTEVKKILKSKPDFIRDSEKEVLNYNQALQELNAKLKENRIKLFLNSILRIQKQVTKELLPVFESGHLRQKPVVVNDPTTRKVKFLPPDAKEVQTLMNDLIEFVNHSRSKVDTLILAGIFHKQMVLIHPFTDGNGRTARLVTKVLLAEMGLNTFNLFSFENYYNQNVTRYFQIVGELGNYYDLLPAGIDFTPWLEYFTGGIIDELLRVPKLLPKLATSPKTELQPYHIGILEYTKTKGSAKATRALDFQKNDRFRFN